MFVNSGTLVHTNMGKIGGVLNEIRALASILIDATANKKWKRFALVVVEFARQHFAYTDQSGLLISHGVEANIY